MVTIFVDGTDVGNQIVGKNTGVVGKTSIGGSEIVDGTVGGTGTGEIYDDGTVSGTKVIGIITYVVTCGIVTTGIEDGINLAGIITGVVVGNLLVGGTLYVDGGAGIYVGTVTTTVDGMLDGNSVGGIITAVVDGKMNTQCVYGAHEPGIITGDANV